MFQQSTMLQKPLLLELSELTFTIKAPVKELCLSEASTPRRLRHHVLRETEDAQGSALGRSSNPGCKLAFRVQGLGSRVYGLSLGLGLGHWFWRLTP